MKDHDNSVQDDLDVTSKVSIVPCCHAGDKLRMYYGSKDMDHASDATDEDDDSEDNDDDSEDNDDDESYGKFDGI